MNNLWPKFYILGQIHFIGLAPGFKFMSQDTFFLSR